MEEPIPAYRRPKVYVTRRIPQRGVDVLLKDCNVSMWDAEDSVARGEFIYNVVGVDAILCMADDVIDNVILDAAGSNLKVIATMGSTFSDINVDMCSERGIRVLKCPNLCSDSRADLTIALMLLTLKTGLAEHRRHSVGGDPKEINTEYWRKCTNLTFGIYGLNTLGESVARRLKTVGIKSVIAHDSHQYKMMKNLEPVIKLVDWEDLLTQSDVLCICDISTNKTNEHHFDKQAFEKMKPNAYIIIGENGQDYNINFIHLYETLRDGKFFAAGINSCNQGPVPYQYPLSGLHNCVFLPQTQEGAFDIRHKSSVIMAGQMVTALRDNNKGVSTSSILTNESASSILASKECAC